MPILRVIRILTRFFLESFRPVAPAPHHPEPSHWPDDAITAAWLGHSTILLNFFGLWVITDPVLATRCGLRFGPFVVGPKRRVHPALTVRRLPPIDLVLLSHAHMDHLDLWTLRRLPGRPHAVTAAGLRDLLAGMPFSGITELAWDQSALIQTPHGPIRVTAREVAHWGARMRTDDWRGYCGFLMERNHRKVGFAGDTARISFSHWANGSDIDLLAIPIGAYNPWVHAHCNPEEAVAMAAEARANFLLPVHHSTFRLSAEPPQEPITRFRAALAETPARIAASEIGQTFRLPAAAPQANPIGLIAP
jgi:L-ascorbate metabolism protein UlaG (beta-lactamase superfamily)